LLSQVLDDQYRPDQVPPDQYQPDQVWLAQVLSYQA
jgi:hypothetical protein